MEEILLKNFIKSVIKVKSKIRYLNPSIIFDDCEKTIDSTIKETYFVEELNNYSLNFKNKVNLMLVLNCSNLTIIVPSVVNEICLVDCCNVDIKTNFARINKIRYQLCC